MPSQRVLQGIGNGVLLCTAILAVAWFWTPAAESLLSIESGSAQVLFRERACDLHPDASVLVLGNSLAGEGFLVNRFNQNAEGRFALNLAVPSAHWFLLEQMAVMANDKGLRPRTILLMTAPEHFSERLDFDFLENDLTLAKPMLGAADILRLHGHTATPLRYVDYAPLLLLRPMLYRGEIRSLLLAPRRHLEGVKQLEAHLAAMRGDLPQAENGNTFSACDVGSFDTLEARVLEMRRTGHPQLGDYERVLAGFRARAGIPMAVDPRELRRFRRVLQVLRGMAPHVVVAPAPYYDPDYRQYPQSFREAMAAAIAQTVRDVPGATLLAPIDTACDDFMDTAHFNRKGAERFTDEVIRAIAKTEAADGL